MGVELGGAEYVDGWAWDAVGEGAGYVGAGCAEGLRVPGLIVSFAVSGEWGWLLIWSY